MKPRPLLLMLAIPLAMAGALVLLLLLIVVPAQQAAVIENAVLEELHDIGGALAISVEFAIKEEELGLLGKLNIFLSDNPTLAMAGVFAGESDNATLIAEFPGGVGIERLLADESERFITRTIPIRTELFDGYVIVASSTAYVDSRVESLRWPLYAAVLTSAIVGGLLIAFLLRFVVTPLSEASKIAATIGREASTQIKPRRDSVSEIGGLMNALMRLNEDLREQRFENQRILQTLEDKVEDRTKELEHALIEKRAGEQRIWEMAHYDELTGLLNRNLFNQEFDALLEAQIPFVLMLTDINDFKIINDTQGHVAGDTALRGYANVLRDCCRSGATIARLGGDEFAILFPFEADEQQLDSMYRDIRSAAEQVVYSDTRQPGLSISMGVARSPHDGNDRLELLRAADTAMYKAKQQKISGSAFSVFHHGMAEHRLRAVEIRDAIKYALAHNELDLKFQPIWDINNGSLISCESLLRWPSKPEYRLDHVIEIAEETGLILDIGEFVIERTLEVAAKTRALAPDLTHSINVSPIQFRYQDLPALLEQKLSATGESARRIMLEITESTFIDNMQRTQLMLDRLHEMGAAVAIDDFGTGYSNLSVLHNFTVDWIKIDKSLISNITHADNNYQIVNAIIQMAVNINMKVVAEGVETLSELSVLRSVGCDRVQGFLLSEPVSEERLYELLQPQRYARASPDDEDATSLPFVQTLRG